MRTNIHKFHLTIELLTMLKLDILTKYSIFPAYVCATRNTKAFNPCYVDNAKILHLSLVPLHLQTVESILLI